MRPRTSGRENAEAVETMKRKYTGNPADKKYSFVSNALFHWKELFVREPVVAACTIILTAVGAVLPLMNAGLPKLVLQGLEQHWPLAGFLGKLSVLILLLASAGLLENGLNAYADGMRGPFEDAYNLRLLKKRLVVDYDVLESRKFNDDAYAVYDSLYRNQAEMKHCILIWQQFLLAASGLIIYGSILLGESIFLLGMVLLPTALTFFLRGRAQEKDKRLRKAAEEANRKMQYVEAKASDFTAGKDIRIFELSGWLMDIFRKERRSSENYVRQWENGYLAANICDALFCFCRDVCAYLFLIVQIVQGRMTVSDFVWYMALVGSCQQACRTLLEMGERLGKLNQDYSRLRAFLDENGGNYFRGVTREKKTEAVRVEFCHVGFTYPGSESPTLKNLDFTISAGEKIALVGLNGAGKTTLVKLLCGLYRPTEGEIRIDGKAISEYEKESYYGLISSVFQNVKLLPLTIAENVSSGTKEEMDRERVRDCLKLAGLWEKVESLPEKENTSLGKEIQKNAIGLSGGEQQKLWMARAFYKKAPLLILDEPTAALDPLAEQEIYEKYVRMSEGRTSLFISHRLSSTRFCDRIFFMENGSILEEGSHEQLLAAGGAYAGLFGIQSRYYQKDCMEQEVAEDGLAAY